MIFTHKHIWIISVPLLNLLPSILIDAFSLELNSCLIGFGAHCQSFHCMTNPFTRSVFQFIFWFIRLILQVFIEDSQESYADMPFFHLCLSVIYFAKLHCWPIGSCFNSLFLRKIIVHQWRNHGCISFGSHIKPSIASLVYNWYPVTLHRILRIWILLE